MRNNFIAEVAKQGRDYYRITNFYVKDQAYALPGKQFFDIPDEIFFKFRNEVFLGKMIVIRKKLLESGKYQIDDFKERKVKKFDQEKQKVLNGLRNRIAGLSVATSFFEVYEFIAVTGILASQGVFITDENREETYLKIINTGNEELINALEKYLEIKDNMDQIFRKYKNTIDFMKRVEQATSSDELKVMMDVWSD